MAKEQQVVCSAIGPDRVGLVEQIAGFLAEHGANIEDSNMAAFCGEFAIILLVTVPEARLAELLAQREALARRTGLTVFLRQAAPETPTAAALWDLKASCLDHPGVVQRLTRVAAEAGVNIESMGTRTESAPWSGAPMFFFEAQLAVPADRDPEALAARFRALATDHDLEISLTKARPPAGTLPERRPPR